MTFINKTPSPFLSFNREQWASLRHTEPMTLTPSEIIMLKGVNEALSLKEVEHIYLPLSRLLNLHIASKTSHQNVLTHFLDRPQNKIPYIIGITGSVAVGKSTTARLLQALLSRWPEHRKVSLITTDGFLYPNTVLQDNNLMHKKGFPESYNTQSLLEFIMQIKMGKTRVTAPVYSHFHYDILPNKVQIVDTPDVLILEGLNILQLQTRSNELSPLFFLSDFIDFSIYVDANVNLLETWYVSRFLKLRESAFKDPNAYFHEYAKLDEVAATKIAHQIWHDVNLKNLQENILPTRERANLVMLKDEQHTVNRINLRK